MEIRVGGALTRDRGGRAVPGKNEGGIGQRKHLVAQAALHGFGAAADFGVPGTICDARGYGYACGPIRHDGAECHFVIGFERMSLAMLIHIDLNVLTKFFELCTYASSMCSIKQSSSLMTHLLAKKK